MRWLWILTAGLVAGCSRSSDPPSPPPPPPKASAPLRGAAGDAALRVMLSELASAKACSMIQGQFRPLRAPDRRDTVTGILWIRTCRITSEGTHVTFHLGGNGWQWADQTQRKAGGTFVVRQYVKFGVSVELPGELDIAYDDRTHVASLWFSPSAPPAIDFAPVGDVAVDRHGLWSSVLGGVSSVFASSPEHQARKTARAQGTHQFESELADGMAFTVNLCTGLSRFNLGRPAKGEMQPPDAGETLRVPIELMPGGLMVFGPQLAPDGMTIDVTARGALRIAMACADKAEAIADAFVTGKDADAPYLAVAELRDSPPGPPGPPGAAAAAGAGTPMAKRRLHVAAQRCPVAVVARSLEPRAAITFDWQRPLGETARSTGGPLIHCAKRGAPARP